eukprot:TRINITY_DN1898_c0_g1_i11.p1 TRINITY_DN1898_c0_g1~~TRINITY_DN1898_c0_g1_i11.p1  ORF type:complete len:262 (+),score=36.13 TRINITY_DN1898_c0_g1_i11:188-973(+)
MMATHPRLGEHSPAKRVGSEVLQYICSFLAVREYTGLRNPGALDFLNCFLQRLFFSQELRASIYAEEASLSSIPGAIQRVLVQLALSHDTVSTKPVTDAVHRACDDLGEFMQSCFEYLPRRARELCEGQTIFHYKASCCGNTSERSGGCWCCLPIKIRRHSILQNEIRRHSSLEHALTAGFASEDIDGYRCDACGATSILQRRSGLSKVPPLLQLELKRYEFDFCTSTQVKLMDYMEIPREICMRRWCGGCARRAQISGTR